METRGRPATTSQAILNHLTHHEWRSLPWPHTDPKIHSALYRLKQKGLIEARPKWDRPQHARAQYRLTK